MGSHQKGKILPQTVVTSQVLGKNIITIYPKALDITWGNDIRYWKFSSPNDDSPVELLQVSWLQVNGKAQLKDLSPAMDYCVKFKVQLKPDNFGWANRPIYLMVKIDKTQRSWRKADLSSNGPEKEFDVPIGTLLSFKTPPKPDDMVVPGVVEFGMYEIWKGNWKGGLVINKVVIEPIPSS